MDHWTKSRVCIACGQPFTLEQHGSTAARTAAQHLTDGTLDPASLPAFISKCPPCFAGNAPAPQANTATPQPTTITAAREQEAVAAAMAIGEQMRTQDDGPIIFYAKRIGMFIAILSTVALFMTSLLARVDVEFKAIPWFMVEALCMATGLGISIWAQRRSK